MNSVSPGSHNIRREDSADSYAGICSEMFSGALAGELGVENAIIVRKLELLEKEPNDTAKRIHSCIPDNAPGSILYNYIWKPLNDHFAKDLYYFDAVSLRAHLRWLCKEHFLFCKNIDGVDWYSVNFSNLNRLYDISKYTN